MRQRRSLTAAIRSYFRQVPALFCAVTVIICILPTERQRQRQGAAGSCVPAGIFSVTGTPWLVASTTACDDLQRQHRIPSPAHAFTCPGRAQPMLMSSIRAAGDV
jgi:hypothetical protein